MKEKPARPSTTESAKRKGSWKSVIQQAMEEKKPSAGWPGSRAGHKPSGTGKVSGRGRLK